MEEEKRKRKIKPKEEKVYDWSDFKEEVEKEPVVEDKPIETFNYDKSVFVSPKREVEKAYVISITETGNIICKTEKNKYLCVKNTWEKSLKSGDTIYI
jgi:hypothetical protein